MPAAGGRRASGSAPRCSSCPLAAGRSSARRPLHADRCVATSWPTRRPSRLSSREEASRTQKAQIARAQRAAGAGSRPRSLNTREQLAGINADLGAVRKKITKMGDRDRGRQGHSTPTWSPSSAARRTSSSVEVTGQESDQADRARRERKADPRASGSGARTTPTGRRCSRSFLVGRVVHRPARRDELHTSTSASRTRPSPSRSSTTRRGARRRSTQIVDVDAQTRPTTLRAETADQKRALDASLKALKAAKAELRQASRRRPSGTSRSSGATYAKLESEQEGRSPRRARDAAKAQRQLAAQIADIVRRSSPSWATSRRSYNGTLQLADVRAT